MCLAIVAINRTKELPLLMVGNRDEYHGRATAGLHWWDDQPDVLAGRDLVAGGTWFGVTRGSRFGLVTNYRETPQQGKQSRGHLLTHFFASDLSPRLYARNLTLDAYAGFNLIIGDLNGDVLYVSNRADKPITELGDGVHAVSNALLDTPWPKLVRVRDAVNVWFGDPGHDAETLYQPLRDMTQSAEPDTPDLDIPPDVNRALTAPFIVGERYGTRSTSILMLGERGDCAFFERRFNPAGEAVGESSTRFSPTTNQCAAASVAHS